MPIRFRCAYCKQLMAISRRKAGSIVSCPKCAGEIIVPSVEANAPDNVNIERPAIQAFDEPDFNLFVDQPTNQSPTVQAPRDSASKSGRSAGGGTLPSASTIQRHGLFISIHWLLIGVSLVILLLIMVFLLGLLIGWKATPPP